MRCECGYSFESGDATHAHSSAEVARLASYRRLARGLGLVIAPPLGFGIVGWLMATVGLGPLVPVAGVVAFVAMIAGGYYTTTGIRDLRRARQMLRSAEETHALPVARLIE